MRSENCVPLIRASPSFGPSSIGTRPTAASAAAPGIRLPQNFASPSPMSTADMCASGARSPDAPTEPCCGTTGITPRIGISCRSLISSQRTPEAPRPNETSFNAIIILTTEFGVSSPTPPQWERMRLRCNA